MKSATELTATVQDGIFKAIETSQRIALEAVGAAMSTLDGFIPETPAMPFAGKLGTPKEAIDSSFGFAERLLASQKSFLKEIATLTAPATPVAAAAKKTA
jgi:hypothetical protein